MKNEHMSDAEFEALVEAGWRRPLNDEEQVRLERWLAAHPEGRATWEAENALNRCVQGLSDAPLASNFTALVLQAVERDAALARRSPSFAQRLGRLFRGRALRVGWALVILCALWLGFHQHRANVQNDVAKGLAVLAHVASLSDPASGQVVLQDFDAIQGLSPGDDEELYAVLNQ